MEIVSKEDFFEQELFCEYEKNQVLWLKVPVKSQIKKKTHIKLYTASQH